MKCEIHYIKQTIKIYKALNLFIVFDVLCDVFSHLPDCVSFQFDTWPDKNTDDAFTTP